MKYQIWAFLFTFIYACAQPPELTQSIRKAADASADKNTDTNSDDSKADSKDKEQGSNTDDETKDTEETKVEPVKDPVVVTPEPEPKPEPVPEKPYSPCPAKGTACLIMPFGDSITAGNGSQNGGGYREPLIKLIWAANKSASFVGNNNNGPEKVDGKAFPRANAGYSGYTIEKSSRAGIAELAVGLLQKHKPHIVTLMIGTNDIGTDNDLPNAPKRLEKLMELIFTTSPDALLVLAQIVPSKNAAFNVKVKAYNVAIAELVKTKAAAGKHVILVDQYAALDGKDKVLADNLHPNEAGYVLMAETWFKGLSAILH